MWLFTDTGFYSIVDKDSKRFVKSRTLCIRARCAEDLDRLREKYLPSMSRTIDNQGTDYPFRAFAPRRKVSRALMTIAEDIDYDNFKTQVGKTLGYGRSGQLHSVWAAMLRIEPKPTGGLLPKGYWDQKKFWEDERNTYGYPEWDEIPTEQVSDSSSDFDDPDEYTGIVTHCLLCGEEVPIFQWEIDGSLPDEDLLNSVDLIGIGITKECQFQATGDHFGHCVVQIEQGE